MFKKLYALKITFVIAELVNGENPVEDILKRNPGSN